MKGNFSSNAISDVQSEEDLKEDHASPGSKKVKKINVCAMNCRVTNKEKPVLRWPQTGGGGRQWWSVAM